MTGLGGSAGGGATVAGRPRGPSDRESAHPDGPLTEREGGLGAAGLTEAEAANRLAAARRPRGGGTSRSYASIVRANVLTVFNLILAVFGTLTLIFGDARDALFLGIIVANSAIGIVQEVRAKRALDRLSLLVAPSARVKRDGLTHRSMSLVPHSSDSGHGMRICDAWFRGFAADRRQLHRAGCRPH